MITKEAFESGVRAVKAVTIESDLVVVGGGLSGVCASITAARQGTKVVLVQDRPVLGGNASSEVRLWALGATSHMGNNNRWSREGGVIDEILVENMYRNKEGNPVLFDTVLLEKVLAENNITLLLNTAVYETTKRNAKNIESIKAFNSQNSTRYTITAPLFCDASGDGIMAFQAGAGFRIGAESKEEFGELFAPDESYGELLGHSMYFYSKRAPHPVKYVAPSFALKDIKEIPRYKVIEKEDSGCRFWWLEYGGRKDTIHDTEEIKYELWKVVYGVWDYIKNSGAFEDVDDLTLEWAATIPGKRESRRFEGLYMIKQQDLMEQRHFEDTIAFGGWAIDLHPADGVYSEKPGCTQWHSKGIYEIPYRCLVSRDIDNLFLAGRIISATHVAFGSTRVMATAGFVAQAVGMAASMCKIHELKPAEILEYGRIKLLQNALNLAGQSIPNVPISAADNLIADARVQPSSSLNLSSIAFDGQWLALTTSVAQLLPLQKDQSYNFRAAVKAKRATQLQVELRMAENDKNYTPDITLETQLIDVKEGEQTVAVQFAKALPIDQYAFVCFMANEALSVQESEQRYSGILSVFNGENKAVSNKGKQTPPDGLGVDTFEFWIPYRRPAGKNIAMEIRPAITAFEADNLGNGYVRPWGTANCWTAALEDQNPQLNLSWDQARELSEIKLFFDPDYDHAMESVQYGHPEDVVPFCVRNYKVRTLEGELLADKKGNYQAINTITLETPVTTKGLVVDVEHPSDKVPASVFEIVCN